MGSLIFSGDNEQFITADNENNLEELIDGFPKITDGVQIVCYIFVKKL